MRIAAFALITAVALPMAAQAQWLNAFDQLSFDAGLGASYGPGYLGADESDAEPWFILRNVTLGEGGEEKERAALALERADDCSDQDHHGGGEVEQDAGA